MIMTTQSIVVLIGIVTVFTTFGIVLAWVDLYTQRRPRPDNARSLPAQDDRQALHDQRRAA